MFTALRTGELRALLQDEDKIKDIIRCSGKVQSAHRAAEKMLVSNQKLAKVSLSQKPVLRDTKLLLAVKYKELEKLTNLIQVKQEELAEKHSLHYAQQCLLKKIKHAEDECELLFQRFMEGKTQLADFLDLFLSLRKLQHIRTLLVQKLQEIIELKPSQSFSEIRPDPLHFSAGLNSCSLTTALVFPTAFCHPPLLLPLPLNANQCLQHLTFYEDYTESPCAGVQGRSSKRPTRPVRLQPLSLQQRRDRQAPQ